MQTKKHNKKRIWVIVLLLLICVAATTFTLMNRLGLFMPDLSGAIDLAETGASKTLNGGQAGEDAAANTEGEIIYGFEASDKNGLWSKETEVEIFRISYENGQAGATVKSSDGDNIIAPGTENTYSFQFKNTGNAAVDYQLTFEAASSPEGVKIPIDVKLVGDDDWIIGDENTFVEGSTLNVSDEWSRLGEDRYKEYQLTWKWDFEGNDEHDTMLGNMAAEQDVVYTIKIKAVATASSDPGDTSGSVIPTGDDSNMTLLWILLGVCAVLMMIMLLWKRDDEDEAET